MSCVFRRHARGLGTRWIACCATIICCAAVISCAVIDYTPAMAAEPEKKQEAKPDDDPPEPLATEEARAAASSAVPLTEKPLTDEDRDHWSFRPLRHPEPPEVANAAWCAGPIDRFILAKLEREQLVPQPQADRRALLRRVTFDLTGLPPSPEEIAAFAADNGPQAFERVVDRLLASKSYGERWGQHWLDLARFAETDGFEHDKVRGQAWRYRDWVIDALNDDLPIDRFIQLQIAGDELRPDDPQAAIATGFLLAGPDMPDINLKEERRHMLLNEITSTVSSALLGLQLGCAQCHDHKYDPLSQADFYRLRAVFETADVFGGSSAGRVLKSTGQTPVSHVMLRGDFRHPGATVEPAFPRIANPWDDRVALLSGEKNAREKDRGEKDAAEKSQGSRRTALARWLTRPDHPLTTRVIANWLWQQHFGNGLCRTPSDFGVMGDSPSHPELLDWLAGELSRQEWSMKRIHRLLVTTNTYRQSTGIAAEEWTPAQAVAAAENLQRARAADPQNRWLARMNRRRLDGEAIRDAMLASADRLSERRGGPGIMAPLPQELLGTLLKGQWKESADEEDHRRRSIYLFVRRNLRYPLFEAFDRPDTNASCPRRNVSTTAPQALFLLNSEFSLAAARQLAGRLLRPADAKADSNADRTAERLVQLYQRTLGRAPSDREIAAATTFLRTQAALLKDTPDDKLTAPLPPPVEGTSPQEAAAWLDLCLAMFNLNEFIYLD